MKGLKVIPVSLSLPRHRPVTVELPPGVDLTQTADVHLVADVDTSAVTSGLDAATK